MVIQNAKVKDFDTRRNNRSQRYHLKPLKLSQSANK